MLAGQGGAVQIPFGSPYASGLGRQPHYSSLSSFPQVASASGLGIQALSSPALGSPALGTPVLGSSVLGSPALSSSAANSARFPPEVRSITDVARLGASPGRMMMRNGLDSTNALSRPLLPQALGSSASVPFGSSAPVTLSRPQVSSPRPPGTQPEAIQQERRGSGIGSPRRGSVAGDGHSSPRRGSVANDGFASPRRGSVQSGRGDGYVSPARSSVISDQGHMDQIASKYVKRLSMGPRASIDYDGTFKTDAIHGDRSDSFKAMESQALARSNSPQRAARSQSPRNRNTWVPSGKSNMLSVASPQTAIETRKEKPRWNLSPSRSGVLLKPRTVEKCHKELYEDAFQRQQRLKELQQHSEQVQEREEKTRMENFGQSMKEWKKLYKLKDTRSQAEREEEMIKKRKETITRREEMKREQELNEMRECTFKPALKKRPGDRGRGNSPKGQRLNDGDDPSRILQQLLERQRNAVGSLQELAVGDLHLREHLSTVHAEYHDRIQREETQRVVLMLQDADTEGSAQRELIDRVRRMVAAGDDPEVAQRQIVEELVARSQDEVKRRVLDAFGPIQLEAEGKLYHKRLSLVHELESIEAQVVALKGGTLVAEAREIGFEFGLADKSRRTLPAVPVLSAMRMTSGDNEDGRLHRAHSTSSSNPTPRHSPRMQSASDRSYMRPSTPRSQAATSDDVSRQSSGQQPSLSGSVLQPGRHDSEDFAEATSSSRSRIGSAPSRAFGLVNAPAQSVAARPHSSSAVESPLGKAPTPTANPTASQAGATTPPSVPLSQALPEDEVLGVPNGLNISLPLGTSMSSSIPESTTSPGIGAPITAKAMSDVKAPMVMQSSPLVLPMSAVQPRVMQDATMVLAPGQPMVVSSGTASPRSLSRRSDNVPAPTSSLGPASSIGSTLLSQPLQHQQLQQQQLLQQQFQQQTQLAQLTAQPQVAPGTYFTGQVPQGFLGRSPTRSLGSQALG